MKVQGFCWAALFVIGAALSLAYATGAITLSLFFVLQGIVITFAAGLQRYSR